MSQEIASPQATPVEVLRAFFKEMFIWESTTYRRSNSTRSWTTENESDLRHIFEIYCVSFDPQRANSCRFPPEYDLDKTTIIGTEATTPGHAVITTIMKGPPTETVLFHAVATATGWKLAGKTIISSYSGEKIEGML